MKLKHLKICHDVALALWAVSLGILAWRGGSTWILLVSTSVLYAAVVVVRELVERRNRELS